MSESRILYVSMGFRHITDLAALDHLLFLVALVAPYRLRDWRQLVLVATAFTIGHSLTLALVVHADRDASDPLIEFLIPVTIVAAALENLRRHRRAPHRLAARGAGGILRPHSRRGVREFSADHVRGPDRASALSFNIGIELGQLLIIIASTASCSPGLIGSSAIAAAGPSRPDPCDRGLLVVAGLGVGHGRRARAR